MKWYSVEVRVFEDVYARDAEDAIVVAEAQFRHNQEVEVVAVYDPDTGEEL